MDVPTLLTMAQTVLQLLDSSVVKEFENFWSFRSQLAKMKDTMSTIKAVLLDAEEQEKHQVQRSQADNDWLQKLNDVVCETDDLFDEVATLAMRDRLNDGVSLLLSHPRFTLRSSRKIKEIRHRLDAIAKDRRDFGSYDRRTIGLGEGSMVKKIREESHSFVRDEDVVGRDDDKRALIDMLLDSSVTEDVSCITIVGIGGLGKTTLAQLAYNDERVQNEFALRLWVCVSKDFKINKILLRILEQLTDKRYDDFGMEKVRRKLQQEMKGKRYLLVLDDIWNENREAWLSLRDLLVAGGRGSRILVTTRSHIVARVIGDGPTYEIEGLSRKDSWRLFEKLAFEEGKGNPEVELVEIGKEIVRRCANIPLAIRIISSLLYGQGISKWRSFRDIDLIHLKQDGVLPVLKLSYYHLEAPLKSCFNYCALFPSAKGIEKTTLIRLWIAQGLVVPSYGQSVEETGEDYFMTLLNRGFFEDVVRGNFGEIISCGIPEVMHNLAQEAAKLEISEAGYNTSQLDGKLRHLEIVECLPNWIASFPVKSMRTVLALPPGSNSSLLTFILKARSLRVLDLQNLCLKSLRVLDLQNLCLKSLPAFSKLLHLRYLDLSGNSALRALPNSLTKLYNLQTLKLNKCISLKRLPEDLRKLVSLKYLEMSGCSGLTHMPPGISCLTNLQSLTLFIVGVKKFHASELNDLKTLINLKGSLTIKVLKVKIHATKVGASYLENMEHLTDIYMVWGLRDNEDRDGSHEALLKELQPHYNLKTFHLYWYPGLRFPKWDSLVNFGAPVSNLVEISLAHCDRLHHLPSLCRLPYLKTLLFMRLNNLEYVEDDENDFKHPASACSKLTSYESPFFPSLERLKLINLPNLKGWRRSSGEHQQLSVSASLAFPRLFVLQVNSCPLMLSIPLCQTVEDVELVKFNEALSPFDISDTTVVADPSSSSSSIYILKRLMIDNMECLKSWPMESLQQLNYMEIYDAELESMSSIGKVFERRLTSLLSLDIFCCSKLRSLSGGGLEHLTALETLRFHSLESLSLNIEDVRPWKSLHHSLRSLELVELPKLVNLPKGMQYLTTLRSLSISQCRKLEALPDWINCLSSLQSLYVSCNRLKKLPKALQDLTSLKSLSISSSSADLKSRCHENTGEDWPKIQHIPHISIL